MVLQDNKSKFLMVKEGCVDDLEINNMQMENVQRLDFCLLVFLVKLILFLVS
jgi:hypothetical protein